MHDSTKVTLTSIGKSNKNSRVFLLLFAIVYKKLLKQIIRKVINFQIGLIKFLCKFDKEAVYSYFTIDDLRKVGRKSIEGYLAENGVTGEDTPVGEATGEKSRNRNSEQEEILVNIDTNTNEVSDPVVRIKDSTVNMASNGDIRVQIFDGKNCSIWKKMILLLLEWEKCEWSASRARTGSVDEIYLLKHFKRSTRICE